jgi:hypothetical protein
MEETTPTSKKIFCVYNNSDPNQQGDTSENLSASGSTPHMRRPRMSNKLRDARIKWQNLRSGSVSTESRNGDTTQNNLNDTSAQMIDMQHSQHKDGPAVTHTQHVHRPSLAFVSDRNIRTSAPDIVVNGGETTKARPSKQPNKKPKAKNEVYQAFSHWEENLDSASDRNINPRTYIYDQNTMYIKKAGASGPNPVLPILSELEENLREIDDNLNFVWSKLGMNQTTSRFKMSQPRTSPKPTVSISLALRTLSREPSQTQIAQEQLAKSPSGLQKTLSMNIYSEYDPQGQQSPWKSGRQNLGSSSLQQSPSSPTRQQSLITKALLTQTSKREQKYAMLF